MKNDVSTKNLKAGAWMLTVFGLTCFFVMGILGATLPASLGLYIGMGVLGGLALVGRIGGWIIGNSADNRHANKKASENQGINNKKPLQTPKNNTSSQCTTVQNIQHHQYVKPQARELTHTGYGGLFHHKSVDYASLIHPTSPQQSADPLQI